MMLGRAVIPLKRLGHWLYVLSWPFRNPQKTVTRLEPWGILLAVFAVLLSSASFWIDYEDKIQERTVRAWHLLTTSAPGNSGKTAALEYLNQRDGFLCGSDDCWILLKEQTPLVGIDLSPRPDGNDEGAYLRDANLFDANLSRAKLNKVDFSGATLKSVDLVDADLRDADLAGAQLDGSTLASADLRRADLSAASLKDVNLRGADLTEAIFYYTAFHGAKIDNETKLSGKARLIWELVNDPIPRRSLRGADLEAANLHNAELKEFNLEETNLNKAGLVGAQLSGATLRSADLQNAYLMEADLRGVNFADANFSNADLTRAQISPNGNFSSAKFCKTRMHNNTVCNRDCLEVGVSSESQSCPLFNR